MGKYFQIDNMLDNLPGNSVRYGIQNDVVTAISANDFSALGNPQDHSALLVGNAATGKLWEQDKGEINSGQMHLMMSQTKFITAMTIYRIMQVNPSLLTLSSKPGDFMAYWPTTGNAALVTLRHLMAFTTGFAAQGTNQDVCSGPAQDVDIEICLQQLATMTYEYTPGTTHQYGSWHLHIAAGMALKAIGSPVTPQGWKDAVETYLYVPAGVTEKPDFPAEACMLLNFVCWLKQKNSIAFSSGMQMSGSQWNLIMKATMDGTLLTIPSTLWTEFTSDQTTTVPALDANWLETFQDWTTDLRFKLGMWHYKQASWFPCDAIIGGGQTRAQAESLCTAAGGPTPNIQHSFGAFGSYVWMDLTNNYYGVFIYNWSDRLDDELRSVVMGLIIGLVLASLLGGTCIFSAFTYKGKGQVVKNLNQPQV
jgi:CubicO group peptidase (beta-lactamase class C family)